MPSSIIPIGFCQCGCGQRTNLADRDHRRDGWIKGQPIRYIFGHQRRTSKPASRALVIDGVECRTIPLTKGKETIVDIAEYDRIAALQWYARRGRHTFYAMRDQINADGSCTNVHMHHDILGVSTEQRIDHSNGNGLDNRRSNLRECSNSQNLSNRPTQANNTSGYKGVSWRADRNKWRAGINHKHLGYFTTPEAAAHAYDEAARRYHGEFAVLNFPDRKTEPQE